MLKKMKGLRFLLIFLLSAFIGTQYAAAQGGSIEGNVSDAEEASPLEGATVRLVQDGTLKGGAYTDADGNYLITPVPAGTYDLIFSYVSYEPDTVNDVAVAAGQTVKIDQQMGLNTQDVVRIYEKVERNTEAQVLNLQRRSASVVDVISIENIKRAGDSDVGSAMKRVTGVTVEGGKYVYVRGLGDRYTLTLLNGSEIPGLDPDRNSVQMDMFPSNLVDNIIVHKTFSPDLPGSFSGGLIKIGTKDFPSNFTLQYSSSIGYNTQASFRNNFISGERGSLEAFGLDDGTRALPEILDNPNFQVPAINFSNQQDAENLDAATKSFATPIYPQNSNSLFNHSHSFSIGNQTFLKGRPFGYVASLSYSNTKNFYEQGTSSYYKLTESASTATGLVPDFNFYNDNLATREALWGGLLSASYLVAQDHQIRINYLHNQNGQSVGRYMEGVKPSDDPNLVIENRMTGYKQRQLDAVQLSGNHTFSSEKEDPRKIGPLDFEWIGSYTRTAQIEPDLRFFSNDYTVSGTDTTYEVQPNLYPVPTRYFRDMSQNNFDLKTHFTLPFTQWNNQEGKIKFGTSALSKSRRFNERRFDFRIGSETEQYNGNPSDYFAPSNMGVVDTVNGLYLYGLYLDDATELRNSYRGEQNVLSGYGMVELPFNQRLRLITGARYEKTAMSVTSLDPSQTPAELDNGDLLPSANLIYALNQDSTNNIMNFRGSYSRTLARPTFRELATFASFDFLGGLILVGNPDLERTRIDNFDLRWELFPTTRELVSVSAFYKNFENSIERVFNTAAQNDELTFRNVPNAQLYGVEFEFRKSLEFLTPALSNFRASGNVVLIKSQVDIDEQQLTLIRELDPDAASTRAMFGQSPYSINGELAYVNDSIGLNASANFNVFGPRISNVSRGATPNVVEQPRPTLDMSIAKTFGRVSVRFRARNLFDPLFEQTQTLNGQDFVFRSYRVGRTFSVGVSYTFERLDK